MAQGDFALRPQPNDLVRLFKALGDANRRGRGGAAARTVVVQRRMAT